ncbi:MAG: class I SAM-dependent methyltransferase [Opitutaceae bacterium]|nr:class I SAM-dependent methyltransferase [Verrucomicrobiales bacterium]
MSEHSAPQHYTGDAGRQYHEGKRGIPPECFDWISRLRAEKFQPYIRPSDVVFEFGVGSGWNLASLQCARKIGCDVADFLAIDVGHRGIEFLPDLNSMPAASVDIVLCHHALEHVPDPFSTLRELKHLIKPGGKLLLCVPFEKERRYRKFNPAEPNHHLFSWNIQTLGNLASDAGFSIQELSLEKFRFDRYAAIQAHRLRLGERAFRVLRWLGLLVAAEFEIRLVASSH